MTPQRTRALKEAAKSGDVGALRAALAEGARPDDTERDGHKSALILAAQGGHFVAVQYLCQAGASLDYEASSGHGALAKAVQGGHEEIVEYLLAQGADPDAASRAKGFTPLTECAKSPREPHSLGIAKLLLDAGADPNLPDGGDPSARGEETKISQAPPLCHACYHLFPEMVELLLRRGADPNAVSLGERTVRPLEALAETWKIWPGAPDSARKKAVRVVEALVRAGATLNDFDAEAAERSICSEAAEAIRGRR